MLLSAPAVFAVSATALPKAGVVVLALMKAAGGTVPAGATAATARPASNMPAPQVLVVQ
jgi:hypothetical protein